MAEVTKKRATYADLEAVPPHLVAEIIDGNLVTRPIGIPVEAAARSVLMAHLWSWSLGHSSEALPFCRMELHLGDQVLVPEIARWGRGFIADNLDSSWLEQAPDWICDLTGGQANEIANRRKWQIYAREGVRSLWLLDAYQRTLETFDLHDGKWVRQAVFRDDAIVSAAPYANAAFSLTDLWVFDPLAPSKHLH